MNEPLQGRYGLTSSSAGARGRQPLLTLRDEPPGWKVAVATATMLAVLFLAPATTVASQEPAESVFWSGHGRGSALTRSPQLEQGAAVSLRISPARSDLRISPVPSDQRRSHLKLMALGFATSIAAHELAHVVASLVAGGKPTLGFDAARPVVYSGIDPVNDRDKQLIFSSAGLVAQIVIDELLLDIPRGRAGSFERGILAGGITTGLFYALVGRNSSVSDVSNIAQSSGLSKAQVGLILGSISALHAIRVLHDDRFAHFFAAPGADGQLKLGVLINRH